MLPNRVGGGGGEDRLTVLPTGVLIHILCFLDTKYAVQTTALSKAWVNLWTLLPDLHFDLKLYRNMVSFGKFIDHMIKRRDSSVSINNFTLTNQNGKAESSMEKLTNYAVVHGVNHLRFHAYFKSYPSCLSTAESLKSLELHTPRSNGFTYPWGNVVCNFRQLTSLHLQHAYLVQDLCAGCPSLEILTLISCYLVTDSLDISAPCLSRLTFSGLSRRSRYQPGINGKITLSTPRLTCFKCVIDVYTPSLRLCSLPVLDTANIHCYVPGDKHKKQKLNFNLLDTLKCLNAKSIILSSAVLELLEFDPETLALEPSPFKNMRYLNLISSGGSLKISAIMRTFLLKAAPDAEVSVQISSGDRSSRAGKGRQRRN